MRRLFVVAVALLAGSSLTRLSADRKQDEAPRPVQWIWFNEGDPTRDAPAQTRYFRKVFEINRNVQKPVDDGTLDITADDQFKVWVNGVEVGRGSNSRRVFQFDVTSRLVHGKNVIAVEATNKHGPSGLLVRLSYVPNGMSRLAEVTDQSWKSSKTAADGWQKLPFDDHQWLPVKVLGPYGKTEPWRDTVWGSSGNDRFTVPEGFRVEMAAQNPDPKDPFSLINLTFDDRGRLLVSNERGGVLLCTKPNKEGVFESVKPYCSQVRSCQGMCWVKDALWLTGNGPQGTGIYRVRDTKGRDETDEVTLIHKFPRVRVPGYGAQGGMGEHGPHAIVFGPDGWLYLVVGNHAWAKPDKLASSSPLTRWPNGQFGPDQGRPDTTEDVLLPRLNDGRGHAANLLAPGGTIWRFDQDGKNWSLVAAGFRNHFDAAFNPFGELFTFDSDMEWDEALPWYRPVRICHCPPGADFVWRTGSANTPNYYVDSLPPIYETGRGSPVGLDFYDHSIFPSKYRGAYFLGDWSLGIIWAAHLKRKGASYEAEVEKFCQGAPMNVTDIAVGPDGALYFTMGGRGSQGGVYRIAYGAASHQFDGIVPHDDAIARKFPQPLEAWSRARLIKDLHTKDANNARETLQQFLRGAVYNDAMSSKSRVKALTVMQIAGLRPNAPMLLNLLSSSDPEIRASAVYYLGVNSPKESKPALLAALQDADALVRRRACEALIRADIQPPIESIWPLLAEEDRFVRTAARLVLQRIDVKNWIERLWHEPNEHVAEEAIIALCKTNQALPVADHIFNRLESMSAGPDVQALLEYLRTIQMALVHTTDRPPSVRVLAERCFGLFPHRDWRVNRELAILLTYFSKEGLTDKPVHTVLLEALLAKPNDRQQQIHYFYCLRLLHHGWSAEERKAILTWYDDTKTWTGGHSFTPFLENILRGLGPIFTVEDRRELVRKGERLPWSNAALLRNAAPTQRVPVALLGDLYERLLRAAPAPKLSELKEAIVETLGGIASAESRTALRKIAEIDEGQRGRVVRILAQSPTTEDWRLLLGVVGSSQPLAILDAIDGLGKLSIVPKAEDPVPYRTAILAAAKVDDGSRWKVVKLLRHWTNGKQFGAEDNDWKAELGAWTRWFVQAFPKEPALPNVTADRPVESKHKFDELLAFLDKNSTSRNGTLGRGRAVFEKAQCIKCHKYGKEGEGIGPDLTTVSKRFKRRDILESIVYPSKVISDQYRSSLIITKDGKRLDGLAAPQGDIVTVLLSDGSKVTLKRDDIDQQFASLVSVMPERLLDTLTKEEVADLFAFLESEPK